MFTATPRARLLLGLLGFLATTAMGAPRGASLGSVKDDDLPQAPARVATRSAASDVALMRAVTWAFEPAPIEVRVQAIEDLGLLGDPRALNFLAQLALDPNPAFAKAGVRAVALIKHPRAEEILSNIIRHPTLPELLKLQAIQLLPMQGSDSAIRFLQQVTGGTYPWSLQGAAHNLLLEVPRERGGLR